MGIARELICQKESKMQTKETDISAVNARTLLAQVIKLKVVNTASNYF